MKYTKEQRLDIGREIYENRITPIEAEKKYGIGHGSTVTYRQLYEKEFGLPPWNKNKVAKSARLSAPSGCEPCSIEEYESMSKQELIHELVKARIREARLKKGYEVKGDGSITQYSKKNIR